MAPMRAGRSELAEDPGAVEELLRAGTARTREAAASVLRDLRPVFRLDRAWPLERLQILNQVRLLLRREMESFPRVIQLHDGVQRRSDAVVEIWWMLPNSV